MAQCLQRYHGLYDGVLCQKVNPSLPSLSLSLGFDSIFSSQHVNDVHLKQTVIRRKENTMAGDAWMRCQTFLMEQAFIVHPLRLQLLSEIWAGLIRYC